MKTIAVLSCAIGLSVAGILLAQEKEQPATFAALLKVGDHVHKSGDASGYSLTLLTEKRLAKAKERYSKHAAHKTELQELQKQLHQGGTKLDLDRGALRSRYLELVKTAGFTPIHRIIAIGSDYVTFRELNSTIDAYIPLSRIASCEREAADVEKE